MRMTNATATNRIAKSSLKYTGISQYNFSRTCSMVTKIASVASNAGIVDMNFGSKALFCVGKNYAKHVFLFQSTYGVVM